jgi:hypothetical protein
MPPPTRDVPATSRTHASSSSPTIALYFRRKTCMALLASMLVFGHTFLVSLQLYKRPQSNAARLSEADEILIFLSAAACPDGQSLRSQPGGNLVPDGQEAMGADDQWATSLIVLCLLPVFSCSGVLAGAVRGASSRPAMLMQWQAKRC